jgi:hypothetical protein
LCQTVQKREASVVRLCIQVADKLPTGHAGNSMNIEENSILEEYSEFEFRLKDSYGGYALDENDNFGYDSDNSA